MFTSSRFHKLKSDCLFTVTRYNHSYEIITRFDYTIIRMSQYVIIRYTRADKQRPLLALLDWRNTPSECMGTSLVQRLMGRRTRILLPTHTKLLEPKVDHQTSDKLAKQKAIQKERYNAKSRPLTPLHPDQAIRMKLPGDTKWSLGSCVKALPNHSYEGEVAGRRYRRNRRQPS